MKEVLSQATSAIAAASSLDALEALRVQYLGKTGVVAEQMKRLGNLPPEEKKSFGAEVNVLKTKITEAIENKKAQLAKAGLEARLASEKIDITLPVRPQAEGKIHPISQVMEEMTAIFAAMGFAVEEGPDIEDDWHNFTALNTPEHHPARAMQDTFYLREIARGQESESAMSVRSTAPLRSKEAEQGASNKYVLRTQTSAVQIRTMQKGKPPFKFISGGRVYRSDWDMTHSPMFHQVEGVYIDKHIHMGHLKGCIEQFLKAFFGLEQLPVRFRPSFFPFTEPSAEVDIGCRKSKESLEIGKGDDWLEILGCGMVHPNVLKNVGLNPDEWQGFAFGMGVERLTMLKYGIPDLRAFYETDLRWLKQYGFRALDIPSLVRGL